eukprot:TRINITY_DN2632_c0_g1_i1.p1 TRINITY_DN2632_c0_g1~~TRINITY_DN2632_c0_g1_i1.p1  ORF type:complete len:339 (+),score=106.17 TRINITY_DN2632_c0_g1_i1:151-1017(+)
MYRIKSSNIRGRTLCVEVDPEVKALYSSACFLLVNGENVLIWFGQYASEREKEVTKFCASSLMSRRPSSVLHEMNEGEESDLIWQMLNVTEKKDYVKLAHQPILPRFFQVSDASGTITVEEIPDFSQDDLDPSDSFILDGDTTIFVWFGLISSEAEKKNSMEIATEYLATVPTPRNGDVAVFVLKAFQETKSFTCHFPAWSLSKFPENRRNIGGVMIPVQEMMEVYNQKYFPYRELLSDQLPPGVDPSKLETYLQEDEFREVFKMSREEFNDVPSWKKDDLKRKVYLY